MHITMWTGVDITNKIKPRYDMGQYEFLKSDLQVASINKYVRTYSIRIYLTIKGHVHIICGTTYENARQLYLWEFI